VQPAKIAVITACLFVAGGAAAQEQGDPQRGQSYAERVCSECHGVTVEDEFSPLLDAPTFKAVANTPGMTQTALSVWFQSPHPSMPNLVIPPEDLANVIAYILSLKGTP
jgi:mono/diheme cytochrome c family protein